MTNVIYADFPQHKQIESRMRQDLREAGWTVEQCVDGAVYCSHPDLKDAITLNRAWEMLYGDIGTAA